MKIFIFTAFPNFFSGVFCSLIDKAIKNKILNIDIVDLKKYGIGKYKKIDDTPYGGGAGMILRADVLCNAIEDNLPDNFFKDKKNEIFITSPRGFVLTQAKAKKISKYKQIAIVCNRYEGVDQRVIDFFNMKEISIGKFILLGGETAATAIVESSVRLIPGVLGNKNSIENETFSKPEYKQHNHFTKPFKWKEKEVSSILISGNHKKISEFRSKK